VVTEESVTRLVLDTEVLVSALLLRADATPLFEAWRSGRFVLATSGPILEEYARALRYEGLRLTEPEAKGILEQLVLPYSERFETPVGPRYCPDPDDDKFVLTALVAQAAAVVGGNNSLLSVGSRVGRAPVIFVVDACARFCR
jgi:putative PIN family toxin of toxin-antitoxin system